MHVLHKYFSVAAGVALILTLSACESFFDSGEPPVGDVPGTAPRPAPKKYSQGEAVNQMSTALTMKSVTLDAAPSAPVYVSADEPSSEIVRLLVSDLARNRIFSSSDENKALFRLNSTFQGGEWTVSLFKHPSTADAKPLFTKTIMIENSTGNQPK